MKKRKITLVIVILLLYVTIHSMLPLMPLFRTRSFTDDEIILDDNSYFCDMYSQNGKAICKCVLTMKNQTGEKMQFMVQAVLLPEYILGSLASPVMEGYNEESQSQLLVLEPYEKKTYTICFVSDQGLGRVIKTDRLVPRVKFIPWTDVL